MALSAESADLLKDFDLVNGSEKKEDVTRARALLCWPSSLPKVTVFAGPQLEVIQTFSAGVDDLPFEQIPEPVKIFSNAGAYARSVSEHAMALILTLCKNVNRKDRANSYPLKGRTLAILGSGGIGTAASKMARNGFGLRTIGISRSFRHPEEFDETLSPDRLDHAFRSADILLCALPLNKFTHGLVNYDYLSKMKKNVVIVNVGRAEAIVENDIHRLLVENPDARFGTDVFWRENSKEVFESKLWELPNFSGTLHRAGAIASPEVMAEAVEVAVRNMRNYLSTGRADNLVNRSDYV